MKHVILGAGPAGVIAAETLRKLSPQDSVVLIGDEPEAPYSRMAVPYLLMQRIEEKGAHLRHGADHFRKLGIDLRQDRATRIDTQAREVHLQSGARESFDRLLIATGSSAATPPIPGIDSPGVEQCWTIADARAIQKRLKKGARVVQMGAGFIGCIILEAFHEMGAKLTVIEMGDRMVPRMMGQTAGTMIKEWCQAKGVDVHTGTKVERIESRADGSLLVHLSTGESVAADLVISATGVKPNVKFAKDSGIDCDVGVLTDDRLKTKVDGIYAAGDCAQAFDHWTGKHVVSAIQPNAADQGRLAAQNMLGANLSMRGVTQINVLDTLGLISSSFGKWDGVPGGKSAELTQREQGRHLKLQFDDKFLVGCNSIGWTEHVGVMRGLVEGKVPLGKWREKLLEDPTKLMEAYLDCAQAQGARGVNAPITSSSGAHAAGATGH